MSQARHLSWDWHDGAVPENVRVHDTAYIETSFSFHAFRSELPAGAEFGEGSSMYLGCMLDVGRRGRVRIGRYVLLNGVRIICDASVEIGDYCLFSWGVVLMDSYRVPLELASRRLELEQVWMRKPPYVEPSEPARPITIGPNVWIGFGVCVLPGVSVGEGSVIGARSVVTTDVEPYTLAAGNPARPIRRLERE